MRSDFNLYTLRTWTESRFIDFEYWLKRRICETIGHDIPIDHCLQFHRIYGIDLIRDNQCCLRCLERVRFRYV